MIIKSFMAESAAAALKKVRSEMGGDAVVLKTREIRNPGEGLKVEITACLDKPSVAQTSTIFPDRQSHSMKAGVNEKITSPRFKADNGEIPVVNPNTDNRLKAIESSLAQLMQGNLSGSKVNSYGNDFPENFVALLRDADLGKNYTEEIHDRISKHPSPITDRAEIVKEMIMADLAEVSIPGLSLKNGERVVFLGLPATGKTSVMGKLAARLVMQNYKVKLVSLDNMKVGAYEEITSYADLLGLEVNGTADSDTNKNKKTDTILLIDVPSISRQEERNNEIQSRLDAYNPTYRLLVSSALMRSSDFEDYIIALRKFKPSHLVLTMTDLTRRIGSVISVCRELGIKLAFITNTPGGIGRLEIPKADFMVKSLLQEEVNLEQA